MIEEEDGSDEEGEEVVTSTGPSQPATSVLPPESEESGDKMEEDEGWQVVPTRGKKK
jgi:hypothetical protein